MSKFLKRQQAKLLWRPKLPELSAQCASCPFREGNDKEFSVILKRILGTFRRPPVRPIGEVRVSIKIDLCQRGSGDFACHGTAYDQNSNLRPRHEHRQCPGATKWWREWLRRMKT